MIAARGGSINPRPDHELLGGTCRNAGAADRCCSWATKNEWLGLLDVAGLELEALFGGFDREPLDDDSRENVFVARR